MKLAALTIAVAAAATATSSLAATRPAIRQPQSAISIGIAEREYHITAYRKTLRPGPARFNITNLGEDTHNLVVTGPRGFRLQGPDVDSGKRASLAATLRRPGTYVLLCTRANHLALGMRTKIEVRR
jgi:plastocyanin